MSGQPLSPKTVVLSFVPVLLCAVLVWIGARFVVAALAALALGLALAVGAQVVRRARVIVREAYDGLRRT